MKALGLVFSALLVSFFSASGFASEVELVCGGAAGTAAVELDLVTVARGGTILQQLVLRNAQIIDYFLEKTAIYGRELNGKSELIVQGYAGSSNGNQIPDSFSGSINNRHFELQPLENGNYRLSASYTSNDYRQIELANFTFADCDRGLR